MIRLVVLLCLMGILAVLPAESPAASTVTPQQASVSATILDVKCQLKPDGEWTRAAVGMQLPVGSRVRTARRSKCEVKFPGGSIVRLAPRGELLISSMSGAASKVRLVSGQVLVNVIKGSGLDVEGAKATVAVQGTWVLFDGEESSVWGGEAEVQTASGKIQVGDRQRAVAAEAAVPLVNDSGINYGTVTARVEGTDAVVAVFALEGFGLTEAEAYVEREAPVDDTVESFPYKATELAGAGSYTFRIPLFDLGGEEGGPIYIAVHAQIVRSGRDEQPESVWSKGQPFGAEGGMFFALGAAALTETNPFTFATGTPMRWWQGLRPGISTRATPGTSVGTEVRDEQMSYPTTYEDMFGGVGKINVIVKGGATQTPASMALNQAYQSAAPLALALVGQEEILPAFGRRSFEAKSQLDLMYLAGSGSSFGGLRLRSAAVMDDVYVELGGLSVVGGGEVWRTIVSEAFAVVRSGGLDLMAGRQHYLDGIAATNTLGSLFSFTTFDGVRAHESAGRLDIDVAWVEGLEAGRLEEDKVSGWLGKLSCPIGQGHIGVTVFDQDGADIGTSAEFSYPLAPGFLDAYTEVGQDARYRRLNTVGVYFPGLYQSAGLDVFIEYSWREGFPPVYSALAAKELRGNWTGVLAVKWTEDEDYEVRVGLVKRFGRLPN